MIQNNDLPANKVLRRANLVHRAEAFLLEVLTAGYSPDEIESSIQTALDRWRVLATKAEPKESDKLRFAGSHDLAVTWLAAHFHEICPDCQLQLGFSGSLGGLMALVDGNAELAGSHIWDPISGNYNEPIVRRLFPGKRVALVTVAHRSLGWMVPPGNPRQVRDIQDLIQNNIQFINRRAGSGTRIRLDGLLHEAGLNGESINGYADEAATHSEVARAVAEGRADVGFGLRAAAAIYGLDYVPTVRERYDLVMLEEAYDLVFVKKMIDFINTPGFSRVILSLDGYDASETGTVRWVE